MSKKETTVIATVELTKIIPSNNGYENKPIAEYKKILKDSLLDHLKNDVFLNLDNINITNVQVFEIEKKERISTEDLIAAARRCSCFKCHGCFFYAEDSDCDSRLYNQLADRLEELCEQLKATPTEQEESQYCNTCKYDDESWLNEPCKSCKVKHSNYERA